MAGVKVYTAWEPLRGALASAGLSVIDWNDTKSSDSYFEIDASLESGVATVRRVAVAPHSNVFGASAEGKVIVDQLVDWVSGSSWSRNVYQESSVRLVNALLSSAKVRAAWTATRSIARPGRTGASSLTGTVAVLEFRRKIPKEAVDSSYFVDLVRGRVLRDAPALSVMTRENVMALVEASGKKLEDCEGECEIETGRRIGADYIVSGDLLRSGSLLKLSLKLHDTKTGSLISTAIASAPAVESLETETLRAVDELFDRHSQQ